MKFLAFFFDSLDFFCFFFSSKEKKKKHAKFTGCTRRMMARYNLSDVIPCRAITTVHLEQQAYFLPAFVYVIA